MTLRERLEQHEAAKCPKCKGLGDEGTSGCWEIDGGCIGWGYVTGSPMPSHATVAALLRFALAVEEADGFSQLRVMRSLVTHARLHLYHDLAAAEGGAE